MFCLAIPVTATLRTLLNSVILRSLRTQISEAYRGKEGICIWSLSMGKKLSQERLVHPANSRRCQTSSDTVQWQFPGVRLLSKAQGSGTGCVCRGVLTPSSLPWAPMPWSNAWISTTHWDISICCSACCQNKSKIILTWRLLEYCCSRHQIII